MGITKENWKKVKGRVFNASARKPKLGTKKYFEKLAACWIVIGHPSSLSNMFEKLKEYGLQSFKCAHLILDEGDYGGGNRRHKKKNSKKWPLLYTKYNDQCLVTHYTATIVNSMGQTIPSPFFKISYSSVS